MADWFDQEADVNDAKQAEQSAADVYRERLATHILTCIREQEASGWTDVQILVYLRGLL